MNLCIKVTLSIYRVGFNIFRFVTGLFSSPIEEQPVMRNHITPPWLWIGMELNDGTIVDKTEEIQHLLDNGFRINLESIDENINISNVKRYFYLDAKTLNEEEFPPEGLVINDTRQ
jgi:hypothetical protein